MSSTSARLESLAAQYGRSPLEVVEFYLVRVGEQPISANTALWEIGEVALRETELWLRGGR